MNESAKSKERNCEIVTFYYVIFGNRVHSGMNPIDARKEASDAVTLRYGISKGRLLNIISSQKCSQNENSSAFKQNALALISELDAANEGLDALKERNTKLKSLLKECLNDK